MEVERFEDGFIFIYYFKYINFFLKKWKIMEVVFIEILIVLGIKKFGINVDVKAY